MTDNLNPLMRGFLWFAPPARLDADPSPISAGPALRESSNEGDLDADDLRAIDEQFPPKESLDAFRDRMREEYDAGLDDVPTRRMERDDPERWEEGDDAHG